MSEEKIKEAFQKAAIASIATLTTPLPIQALGRTIEPPNDHKYFEFVQIPNNRSGDFWGEERIYQGIFRIILHWPITDEGDYQPVRVIDALSVMFPKSRILIADDVSVKIYDVPDLTSAITTSADRLFPLSLKYRSFKF